MEIFLLLSISSCTLLLIYGYLIYPLCLALLNISKKQPHNKKDIYPDISFIVSVYNGEKDIENKIINTINLEYPSNKIEFIFISDCSDDKTDKIIQSYKEITYYRLDKRSGKEYALNYASQKAKSEILVFSDVATLLDRDAIKNITANFADHDVGSVSSIDKVISTQKGLNQEKSYVGYEMLIRKLESNISSLVGMSGSFFAIRKSLYSMSCPSLPSDFNLALACYRESNKSILDPNVVGYYKAVEQQKNEFKRKVRTMTGGLRVMQHNIDILNPFRYGIYSWQVFSHKVIRWLSGPLILTIFILSFIGSYKNYQIIHWLFAIQVIFYSIAAIALLTNNRLSRYKPIRLSAYFLMANLACIAAWYEFLKGNKFTTWESSKR